MFSALDTTDEHFFHTGRNSKTKKECESDMIGFLFGEDPEFTEEELQIMVDDDVLRVEMVNSADAQIIEHQKPLPELEDVGMEAIVERDYSTISGIVSELMENKDYENNVRMMLNRYFNEHPEMKKEWQEWFEGKEVKE